MNFIIYHSETEEQLVLGQGWRKPASADYVNELLIIQQEEYNSNNCYQGTTGRSQHLLILCMNFIIYHSETEEQLVLGHGWRKPASADYVNELLII